MNLSAEILSDEEVMAPKVGTPMANRLHRPDQFPLIGGKLQVMSHEQATEEGEGTDALMEDRPKPIPQGITVHREWPVEVGQMEDGGGGECALEGVEGHGCLGNLGKALLPEQLGEGR